MNAFAYSIMAAFSAVGAEVWYKAHPGVPWGSPVMWPGIVLALLVNYGIWGTLQTESLLGLTVLFSLCTATLRIAWTAGHGDHVAPAVWVAFALVVVAGLVKTIWHP